MNPKIYIVSASLFLFAGCVQQKPLAHIPPRVIAAGVDFTPFTARGFLFTPERYPESYESIGVITITIWPEANREVRSGRRVRRGGQDTPAVEIGDWVIEPITIQDALESMYERASEMGADAVVNLEISRVVEEYASSLLTTLVLPGIEVSGFAIKRQQ